MVFKNRHFKDYLTTSSALQVSLLCLAEHIQPFPLCHFLLFLGETPALHCLLKDRQATDRESRSHHTCSTRQSSKSITSYPRRLSLAYAHTKQGSDTPRRSQHTGTLASQLCWARPAVDTDQESPDLQPREMSRATPL